MATDVIKEFAADGVKYLELRSTPREEKNTGKAVNFDNDLNRYRNYRHVSDLLPLGLTKKRYVETVLKAIQQCRKEDVDIDVRLARIC